MNVTIGSYQLRPYQNGLCWELWEYRPVKSRETGAGVMKWVSTGYYPSNLSHGLLMIYERMLKGCEGTYGAKQAIDRAEEISRRIIKAAKERCE